MKILILGKGRLGTELHTQTNWDCISRKEHDIDFTDTESYQNYLDGYDCVINCIANCNTYSSNKDEHWDVNYKGVANLVDMCNDKNIRLVHISTDYVYTHSVSNASEDDVPVHCRNWYGYTKLLSDGYVQLKSNDYLLVRTNFQEKPFPHPKGWLIKGNFDYVDVIVGKIISLIKGNHTGLFNVGTELKTYYELGKRTNPELLPSSSDDDSTPSDVSMNVNKIEELGI